MTIAPIAPIRRVVSVPTSQQRASEVFTQQITSWWPADHHIGSAPIEEIVVEPREGGRWYTRHRDGTETSTGYVSIWRPYDRLALTWQIGADWRYDPKLLTIVELRFVPKPRTAHGSSSSIATLRTSVPTHLGCDRSSTPLTHGRPR